MGSGYSHFLSLHSRTDVSVFWGVEDVGRMSEQRGNSHGQV